jgi:hypothetical protein
MGSSSPRACACGRHYDAERWAALPLFARFTGDDLSLIISPCPADLVVEVRVCGSCRRQVSRLCIQEEVAKKASAVAA